MKHLFFGVILNWIITITLAAIIFGAGALLLVVKQSKTDHPEGIAWRRLDVCLVDSNIDYQRMSEIVAWCREDNSSIMIILEE